MNNKISETLIWALMISPLLFLVIFWNDFPNEVPIHWNLQGEPDDFGSKVWGLLILPITNFFIYGVFRVIPFIDPNKENHELFSGKRKMIQLLVHTFLTALFFVTSLEMLGVAIDMTRMIMIGLTLLLMGIGNYMSNVRQNYFIGVRTPWTLANEDVWRETHRFTAKLWVFASFTALFGFAAALLPPWTIFIYISIISIAPIAYSYLIYKKISTEQ